MRGREVRHAGIGTDKQAIEIGRDQPGSLVLVFGQIQQRAMGFQRIASTQVWAKYLGQMASDRLPSVRSVPFKKRQCRVKAFLFERFQLRLAACTRNTLV